MKMKDVYPRRERYKPHIFLSGFVKDSPYEQSLISKIIKLGAFLYKTDFNVKCTHLVCAKPSRSEKFLSACSTGKLVVTPKYVEDSFKQSKWLHSFPYLWSETHYKADYGVPLSVYSAETRCRNKIRENKIAGMFSDWTVALNLNNSKRMTAYRRILQNGGATVIKLKFPIAMEDRTSHLTHVFVDKDKYGEVKILISRGVPCLTTDYISHYLLIHPCPDVKSFSIESYSSSCDMFCQFKAKISLPKKLSSSISCSSASSIIKRKYNDDKDEIRKKLKCSDRHDYRSKLKNNLGDVENLRFSCNSANAENEVRKLGPWLNPQVKVKRMEEKVKMMYSSPSTPDRKQSTLDRFVQSRSKERSESNNTSGKDIKKYKIDGENSKACRRLISIYDAKNASGKAESDDCTIIAVIESPKKYLTQQMLSVQKCSEGRSTVKQFGLLNFSSPKKMNVAKLSPKQYKRRKMPSQQEKNQLTLFQCGHFSPNNVPVREEKNVSALASHVSSSNYDFKDANMFASFNKLSLSFPSPASDSMNKTPNSEVIANDTIYPESNTLEPLDNDRSSLLIHGKQNQRNFDRPCLYSSQNACIKEHQSHEVPCSITAIFEACRDEKHYSGALDFLSSVLSFKQYPESKSLNSVMFEIFLKSKDKDVIWKANDYLYRLLSLHPPSNLLMRNYYLFALTHHQGAIDNACNVLHDLLSKCIESVHEVCPQLLLTFIVSLMKQDFEYHRRMNDRNQAVNKKHQPLVLRMYWPSTSCSHINNNCRKLFNLIGKSLVMYTENHGHSSRIQQIVVQLSYLINVLAECCEISSEFCVEEELAADRCGSLCSTFASELASILNGCVHDANAMNFILELLRPAWLSMKVSEHLLGFYRNIFSLPSDHKLSISKIVRYYVYLSPELKIDSLLVPSPHRKAEKASKPLCSSSTTAENSCKVQILDISANQIKNINKKNMRGETLLHVACIRNNVKRVKELLTVSAIDVNIQDNAGWTAAHEASNHGNVDCLGELLKYRPKQTIDGYFLKDHKAGKVDLTLKGFGGITVLHDAVQCDQIECVRLLLNHGGSELLSVENDAGHRPIQMTVNEKIIEVLKSTETNEESTTFLSQKSMYFIVPSVDDYTKQLGKGQLRKFATRSQCRRLVVILLHLFRSYVDCRRDSNPNDRDVQLLKKFPKYADRLRNHIREVTNDSDIELCEREIDAMKVYAEFACL